MKACKFCGTEIDNAKRKCPSCGSTDLLHICENCGERFEGMYCPKCGVKVGQKGKTCPECQTVYFSNACPNCGYTLIRKAKSTVSTPPPARPSVTARTGTETIGKTYTPPSIPASSYSASNNSTSSNPPSSNPPKQKGKKRWLPWVIAIIILIAVFGGNSKKETKTKETATSHTAVTVAPKEKATTALAKVEAEATTNSETEATATSTEEPLDEMTALQAFYDDFSANGTADNLEELVGKYGLY